MERQISTGENTLPTVIVLRLSVLISVCMKEMLFTHTISYSLTLTITHIDIGIQFTTGIIEVATHIPTTTVVDSCTQRSIVAGLTVALEDDINDTRRTLGTELSRGVVNNFYALDTLSRNLLKDITTIVGSQTAGLAIDPHLDAAIATQGYLTVSGNLNAGDVFQQIRSSTSCCCQNLVDSKRLTVNLQFHL